MPRMSESEMALWRERSEHADHIWREKGLIGDNKGPGMTTLLDAYRGDQWKHIGFLRGVDTDSHLVVNSMFSAANTLEASLLARLPQVNVTGRTSEAAQKAQAFENLINYAISEVKCERAWNAALRDGFFRFGVVRVGYTPTEEVYTADGELIQSHGPTTMDLPWVRRVAPWDIRIDPLADSWHSDGDARWCEFISLHTIESLKKNPGMSVPRDLTATVSRDKRLIDERRRGDAYRYEAANLVEVRTVYDLSERKWFQWSPGSDKLLRDPEDWPVAFEGLEGLPYSLLAFNEPSDDACPIGYAEKIWQLQKERNKVRTMLSELMRRHRRMLFGNTSAFDEHERQKIVDGEIVDMYWASGDVNGAIAQANVAGFDPGFLAYDQLIQEDIRELIGQSRMAHAQRINVESATEAARVAQGDDAQSGRNQLKVEAWLRDSVNQFAKCIQSTITDDLLVPAIGQRDAAKLMGGMPEVIRIRPEDLQGEFMFKIEPGSTLPPSEKADVGKAMAWLQVAQQFPNNINIPQALMDLALAMGKDPATALANAQQMAAANAALPGQPQMERPAGNIDPAALLQARGLQ